MISPAPSCRLLEVDFSGIEARQVAWFARDRDYYRLAGLGPHAHLASCLVGQPGDLSKPDAELKPYYKAIKKAHPSLYEKAKRNVHGTGYGMTPMGMFLMFPDVYKDLKDAQATQDVYWSVAPAVKAWQWQTQIRAHEQGYLGGPSRTPNILDDPNAHPYGYRDWFWSVLTYKPIDASEARQAPDGTYRTRRGVPVVLMNGRFYRVDWGEEAKSALAWYPQGTASGNLKEVEIPLLADRDHPSYIGDAYFGRTPLRAPIHDSLLMEIPNRAWDRVVERVAREMRRPIEEQPIPLEWGYGAYLTVDIEAKASSRSWAHMEEIPLPGMSELGLEDDRTYFPAEESEEEEVADLRIAL